MILQLMSHFFPSTADATMRLLTSISESFETIILNLSSSAVESITEFVKNIPFHVGHIILFYHSYLFY